MCDCGWCLEVDVESSRYVTACAQLSAQIAARIARPAAQLAERAGNLYIYDGRHPRTHAYFPSVTWVTMIQGSCENFDLKNF